MKTCNVCKQEKPLGEFIKANKSKKTGQLYGDGRKSICLECSAVRKRKWIAAMSPDKRRAFMARNAEAAKLWSRKRPFYQRAMKANLHARRVGAKGTVTESDVVAAWKAWDGKCWCCGSVPTETDHFRPLNGASGGKNTPDNLRPICRDCNQKRSHRWHGETVANKEAKLLKALKELLA